MNKPIRVLLIHQSAELYGSDKVMLQLASRLDKNVFQPIILLPETGPLEKELEKVGVEYHITPTIKISRSTFTLKGLIKLPLGLIHSIRSIDALLENRKVDVVHSNTLAVLSGAFWAKLRRVPHVWHVHEIIERPSIVRRAYALLLHLFADKVMCNSHATAEHLYKDKLSLRGKSVVVWNGLDVTDEITAGTKGNLRKELSLKADDVLVTLVGRINRWKGQRLLIAAAGELVNAGYKNVKYLIVGGPPPGNSRYLEELEQDISNSPAGLDISIIPFTNDIWPIWGATDIAVVPSTEPEPFGMVALEAMAARKPVVASSFGGLVEIVVDGVTGCLFEPGNAIALAGELEILIKSDRKRIEMGEAGYARLQKVFSINNYVMSIEDIYHELHVGA
tara:strand:+ start:8613 stop:9788 length:1176 start_codon:yes stop_codon:yes gene_type:complete